MTIEKVHGLHATSITLNERFTLLAEAPLPRVLRSKRRSVSQSLSNKSFNFQNRNLVQQIAYHLEQANRQAVKQRLGLRRYGSESSLPGLRRSNSTGNLSQLGIKNRLSWRQFNGNLSQGHSFNNLVTGMFRGRGFRRRGARMGLTRGRMRGRGGRQTVGRLRQAGAQVQAQRGRAAGGRRARGRGRGVGGGGGRRGGTGGAVVAAKKPIPTKEELDLQLDQYMASTRWALDKQLDAYMDSAMKFE